MSTFDYEWRRSSFCASGACVDVRRDGDTIVVRDGKFGDCSIEQTFSLERWPQMLSALANGEDHPDVLADDGYVRLGRITPLFFTADEWNAFVAGVKNGEFDPERLSSPTSPEGCDAGEVGPAGNGPDHAATGAGAIAVPPVPVAAQSTCQATTASVFVDDSHVHKCVREAAHRSDRHRCACGSGWWPQTMVERRPAPVAAQPHYVLDRDAVMDMVERYGDARAFAADRYAPEDLRGTAEGDAADLFDAIRGALTPVPASEPEPAWGSGPLVKHVTEIPDRRSSHEDHGVPSGEA